MKKLIVLLSTIMVMMPITVFASYFSEEKEDTTTVKTLQTDKGVFSEPVIRSGSMIPFYGLTNKLRWKYKRNLHIAEPSSESIPMSKFQMIIDKDGQVLDVIMFESTDMAKDQIVLKYLQTESLFLSPATLDDRPCNAIGIFSIRYLEPSPSNMTFYAYPLTTE